MPIYEYECPNGHAAEAMRSVARMDAPILCDECGAGMVRVMSLPAKRTDGIYSYAPNIGDPDTFERRHVEATALDERVAEMKDARGTR